MKKLVKVLAEGEGRTWRLVYEMDDPYLFVECVQLGEPPTWIGIEDFFAIRPQDEVHQRARNAFLSFLEAAMIDEAHSKGWNEL